MIVLEDIIGLPWQLAEGLLRAANVPFTVSVGQNYNKFFKIDSEGYYVARITNNGTSYEVLLFHPMINSAFEKCKEVQYAETIIG